ncbi:hypothetical protein [Streptomyces sp. 7-21]|jgi:hypothetical protein|uniref:hypothetical protein n=1 Tax=Streptomyces sp. 7-21 TaxID=2802283 RepID=UPI00191F1B70|nr:hypothetical protein [Streptomyces sp. 7-21]MBL1068135.1 hypothetical protein [Streptomyces sp. 7-21]
MTKDPLAHFLRQLSPENREWLEHQPEDKQRVIAEQWQRREGRGAALLSSIDLMPDLVDDGASANAFLQDVRDSEEW